MVLRNGELIKTIEQSAWQGGRLRIQHSSSGTGDVGWRFPCLDWRFREPEPCLSHASYPALESCDRNIAANAGVAFSLGRFDSLNGCYGCSIRFQCFKCCRFLLGLVAGCQALLDGRPWVRRDLQSLHWAAARRYFWDGVPTTNVKVILVEKLLESPTSW